jgi:phosphatidylserine/phosphatidylglycerophosphate/cardiolipin synthase-like enzyme
VTDSALLATVVEVTSRLPRSVVEELADAAERSKDVDHFEQLVDDMSHHPAQGAAAELATAWRATPAVPAAQVAAMLHAAAASRASLGEAVGVDVVMTGPSTPMAPTRSTEAVVVGLVEGARHDLLLVTYSAMPYAPLLRALTAASDRGVSTVIVVETVEGARGLLGSEPAAAFAEIGGVDLLHWPLGERTGSVVGRLHAKLAVADRRSAFVTSANLTESALTTNIECGLLVHGGAAPQRLWDHFAALRRAGVLLPWSARPLD